MYVVILKSGDCCQKVLNLILKLSVKIAEMLTILTTLGY